jgi:hypothetical protein
MPRRYLDRPYAWRTVVRALRSKERRTTVYECLVLSLKELFDRGLIERGAFSTGSWRWADSNHFQVDGTIRYEADLRSHEKASLRLKYEVDRVAVDYDVSLASEEQGLLGRRWWFRCPVNGVRVTKLYLPPGAIRFASRQAHELTYTSRQGPGRPSQGGVRLVVKEVRTSRRWRGGARQ